MKRNWECLIFMQKQNTNSSENIIEINGSKEVVSFSPLKVFLKPLVVVNTVMLTIAPVSKTASYIHTEKSIIVEQGNSEEFLSYPTVSLKYENGNVSNMILNETKTPVRINSDFQENTAEIKFHQIIGELREENAVLRNRLKNSLPVHTLVYLVINSAIATFSVTLLFIRFFLNIYIIDPYYLICALIISIGLFSTACASLKDWKANLLNENCN